MQTSEKFRKKIKKLLFFFKNLKVLLLVLPFKVISIRLELSSPPRLLIQGGYPERDTGVEGVGVVVTGLYFPFLI